MTLLAATVLQNVVFINLQLSEHEKILRFTKLADLYKQIGFHRKASFCSRLAATRFVSSQNPTPDWTQCYNFILQALSGLKMSLDPTEFSKGQSLKKKNSFNVECLLLLLKYFSFQMDFKDGLLFKYNYLENWL